MRRLLAVAMVGAFAFAESLSAKDVDDGKHPSRFAMQEARVESEAVIANDRFHLRAQFVRNSGAETLEAQGFSLQSQLIAKGSGCPIADVIFVNGFE